MAQNRPTLQDIADATGLSRSGVSRALRGDLRIPEATRRKVEQAAARIGYRPNPLISILMGNLKEQRGVAASSIIAVVSGIPEREIAHHPYFCLLRQGLLQRAQELGYRLDNFSLAAPGMNEERLIAILKARGIHGIIFAFFPSGSHLQADWSSFAIVAMDQVFASPAFHHVINDHFQIVRLALAQTYAKGYRRIGVLFARHLLEAFEARYMGGLTSFREEIGTQASISTLSIEPRTYESYLAEWQKHIPRWLKANACDALVAFSDGVPLDMLTLNYRIPQDYAVASLDVHPDNTGKVAGIRQNYQEVARAALDTIDLQLYRNQRGIPASARTIAISGNWIEGATMPAHGTCAIDSPAPPCTLPP